MSDAPIANPESDPAVAKQNALANFQRMMAGLPQSTHQREARLVAEIGRVGGSPLKQLRYLYRAMDALSKDLAPYVACHAGCSACCHYPVSVYPLEAELIEKRTGHRRRNPPISNDATPGSPCPFLIRGMCSIYNDRPWACRAHVSLTNTDYWCDPSRSDQIELPLASYSEANAALEHIIRSDGRGEPLDIRDVFGERTIHATLKSP